MPRQALQSVAKRQRATGRGMASQEPSPGAGDAPHGATGPIETSLLRDIAISTLVTVAQDKTAPAAARSQSARALAEIVGLLGAGRVPAEAGKPVSEMSGADIEAELTRLAALAPDASA